LISSRRSSAAVAAAALAGCASAPLELPPTEPLELTSVPFFPQADYQCGPAALATLLAHAGLEVSADDLVEEVYVAGLRGSLQAELLGSTRRHGLVPFVIAPEPTALLAELRSGRPVLVLQNLGIDRVPVWHYAVVVGADGERIILRSGTEQRRIESTRRFLRSWQRGSSWAFVVAKPGEIPATAGAATYVRAVAGAEPMLDAAAAERAYAAALARWPGDEVALLGAANQRHAAADLAGATTLYRQLLAAAPDHAVARNNLANVLAERGCRAQALREARIALASAAPDAPWYAAIRDTLESIERQTDEAASTCP
jgi:hypothetical protein